MNNITDVSCKICPKCNTTSNGEEGLVVSILPFNGIYCIKCWAKWISENIPKMIELRNETEEKLNE